ncbi:hypothetical protein [Nitrococcus mobilis]|uniref:Uncharacterized protein n=1 Tax=Nitrococcus mobilis Nb-231 TaxID=314278 RepID=A4BPV2_9GAMM|nr:hypothetical protein [Nitrococcus mobilis]EAR22107.1 hypothetical protein NB231_04340 [Nitrococcus mobilis Nb-231]
MRFVANLRNETIEAFATESIQPRAYLLSSHRLTPATLKAAEKIRALGLPLFADNGTKPMIDATIDHFAEPAKRLRTEVKQLRKALGHVPRGAGVPAVLRDRASRLAQAVLDHTLETSEAIDAEALLTTQLSMLPTDLIAQEDFATACLIALDLERETTGWRVSRFDTRNRRTLRLWKRVANDTRCKGIRVHAVLSAMDYNTARSAGRLAARAGVRHAAVGIAGITRDPSATDFFVMETKSIRLARPVPRRYVRLAQIIRGFAEGFGEAGRPPESFHCLGLGAPYLFPVTAAALAEATRATTDATSPIHAAVRDRVLYDPVKDGDRASTKEIVDRIVRGGDWPFLSPFTRAFREKFGHDPEAARKAWAALGKPAITRQLLEVASPLTASLPLFADADDEVRKIAARAWIAHNHWVLGAIADSLPNEKGRRDLALSVIDRLLSNPPTMTTRGLAAAREVILSD